jgi:hypothetical protein
VIAPSRQAMADDPAALRRAESELLYRQSVQVDALDTLAELLRAYAEDKRLDRDSAEEFLMGISALVKVHSREALAIHVLADEIQLAQSEPAEGRAR